MDSSGRDGTKGDVPTTAPLNGVAGEAMPTDWSALPVVQGNEDSVVMVLWRLLRQEPALIVSAGYVLISLLGLWSSYFFYLRFQLSILDYLQISDFLVAGLRDPAYAGILAGGILLAILVGWPDTLRRRNPAQVDALRARHWGWPADRPVHRRGRLHGTGRGDLLPGQGREHPRCGAGTQGNPATGRGPGANQGRGAPSWQQQCVRVPVMAEAATRRGGAHFVHQAHAIGGAGSQAGRRFPGQRISNEDCSGIATLRSVSRTVIATVQVPFGSPASAVNFTPTVDR